MYLYNKMMKKSPSARIPVKCCALIVKPVHADAEHSDKGGFITAEAALLISGRGNTAFFFYCADEIVITENIGCKFRICGACVSLAVRIRTCKGHQVQYVVQKSRAQVGRRRECGVEYFDEIKFF